MPVVNANSVNPDQTPRSAASDLGLHCLPMSHLWDARHKWVKGKNLLIFFFFFFFLLKKSPFSEGDCCTGKQKSFLHCLICKKKTVK